MSSPVEDIVEKIILNTEASKREEVRGHLRICGFTSPDDPMLNAIAIQAILASQPVRLATEGGAHVATEPGLARLGDRFDAITSTLMHLKVRNIFLSWMLCILIGGGALLLAAKSWPVPTASFLNLPPAPDPRVAALDQSGAQLHVEKDKGVTYVYITGDVTHGAAKTPKGMNYLFIGP